MTAPAAEAAVQDPVEGPRRVAFRLAATLVALTILVIVKGAMVTSTGSGLAFADWPLSDGQLMPERSYTTLSGFFEHFHRLFAALAGLLAIALVIFVFRARVGGPRLRQGCAAGLLLICVQGALGGTGVLSKLPVVNSAAHGTLAQVTVATFAVLAYALSARWQATVPRAHASAAAARKLGVVAVAALLVQTVIGALARHGGDATALWTHVGNAFVTFLLLLIAAAHATGRLGHVPGVKGLGRLLLWLLVAQLVLGFVALLVRTGKHPENIEHLWRASLISAHVLNGSLLTLAASLLCAHVFRGTAFDRARAADV
jgi:cytochrome c oxidase assembly protein subunit 15